SGLHRAQVVLSCASVEPRIGLVVFPACVGAHRAPHSFPTRRSSDLYYNQIVADEDALYSETEWKAIEDRSLELYPRDEIMLGFDGGRTRDATALVALRVRDMFAVPIRVWESEGEGWEIDRAEVNSAVHDTFKRYRVLGFYADVNLWESDIADWDETYGAGLKVQAKPSGNAIAWDMRQSLSKITMAHERLVGAIFDRKLRHNGDPILRRHVLNA